MRTEYAILMGSFHVSIHTHPNHPVLYCTHHHRTSNYYSVISPRLSYNEL